MKLAILSTVALLILAVGPIEQSIAGLSPLESFAKGFMVGLWKSLKGVKLKESARRRTFSGSASANLSFGGHVRPLGASQQSGWGGSRVDLTGNLDVSGKKFPITHPDGRRTIRKQYDGTVTFDANFTRLSPPSTTLAPVVHIVPAVQEVVTPAPQKAYTYVKPESEEILVVAPVADPVPPAAEPEIISPVEEPATFFEEETPGIVDDVEEAPAVFVDVSPETTILTSSDSIPGGDRDITIKIDQSNDNQSDLRGVFNLNVANTGPGTGAVIHIYHKIPGTPSSVLEPPVDDTVGDSAIQADTGSVSTSVADETRVGEFSSTGDDFLLETSGDSFQDYGDGSSTLDGEIDVSVPVESTADVGLAGGVEGSTDFGSFFDSDSALDYPETAGDEGAVSQSYSYIPPVETPTVDYPDTEVTAQGVTDYADTGTVDEVAIVETPSSTYGVPEVAVVETPSSTYGVPEVAVVETPSTYGVPEVAVVETPSSTYGVPEVAVVETPSSTYEVPEVAVVETPSSTYGVPEVAVEETPSSTYGVPEAVAQSYAPATAGVPTYGVQTGSGFEVKTLTRAEGTTGDDVDTTISVSGAPANLYAHYVQANVDSVRELSNIALRHGNGLPLTIQLRTRHRVSTPVAPQPTLTQNIPIGSLYNGQVMMPNGKLYAVKKAPLLRKYSDVIESPHAIPDGAAPDYGTDAAITVEDNEIGGANAAKSIINAYADDNEIKENLKEVQNQKPEQHFSAIPSQRTPTEAPKRATSLSRSSNSPLDFLARFAEAHRLSMVRKAKEQSSVNTKKEELPNNPSSVQNKGRTMNRHSTFEGELYRDRLHQVLSESGVEQRSWSHFNQANKAPVQIFRPKAPEGTSHGKSVTSAAEPVTLSSLDIKENSGITRAKVLYRHREVIPSPQA